MTNIGKVFFEFISDFFLFLSFRHTCHFIMPLSIHELKVDQTAFPIEEHFLLVSNINIPEPRLHTDFDDILTRIHAFIVKDYINVDNLQFQVCATYELRNTINDTIKLWTGNFNPKGNQLNALNQFHTFSPQFKETVKNACSTDNIYQKLTLFNVDTNWTFHQLVSIYITVQGIVYSHHPTILQKNLIVPKSTRRRHGKYTIRTHVSFQLP